MREVVYENEVLSYSYQHRGFGTGVCRLASSLVGITTEPCPRHARQHNIQPCLYVLPGESAINPYPEHNPDSPPDL
jgi:hypothetical protein